MKVTCKGEEFKIAVTKNNVVWKNSQDAQYFGSFVNHDPKYNQHNKIKHLIYVSKECLLIKWVPIKPRLIMKWINNRQKTDQHDLPGFWRLNGEFFMRW